MEPRYIDPKFTASIPTYEEVDETAAILRKMVDSPSMKLRVNEKVRNGYLRVIDILTDRNRDVRSINGASVQERAIAAIGIDYLNGTVTRKMLLSVPLKKK